ncbi:MAG: sarcosine oxidase subunit gamma [Phaeovulum sp.]|uniref:sarcosine oxidase subunit gamma n=1 Tax=Phaeovulum sp. TaxID=2934796 RepID=UPI0027366CF2|nr:sarcosine oxidase subunit gamma [Phaeovulum sp.]MDP3862517.1 sarcosine oxidase subunit gamma [Phaeovulum sp.]
MADFIATDPLAALLPTTRGAHQLAGAQPGRITALAPIGPAKGLPAPGRAQTHAGGIVLWAGHGLWLATGTPPQAVPQTAPQTDETDAWVIVRLSGPAPDAVLARLVPIDLRALNFRPGHVARTLLGHVAVLIHRPEAAPEALEIWLPRSMAAHALIDLASAMRGLAAR